MRDVDPHLPHIVLLGAGVSRAYREYALASVAGVANVTLLDKDFEPWHSRYVASFVNVDLSDRDSVLTAVAKLTRSAPFDGVLCWDERYILVSAQVCDAYGLPGPSISSVASARDKLCARDSLSLLADYPVKYSGVGDLNTLEAECERIGFPVVVKPRSLAGSVGVSLVTESSEVPVAWNLASSSSLGGLSSNGSVLVEEYLDGPEYSVECVCVSDAVFAVAVTEKISGPMPYFEEIGHIVDSSGETEFPSGITKLACLAVETLGLRDCVVHVEVKVTATGPRIVEANARLGGDLIPRLVLLATGIDLCRIAAMICVGRFQESDLIATLGRVAASIFIYPEQSGIVKKISRPLFDGLVDSSDLCTPGDELRLPPDGFLERAALGVVATDRRQHCFELAARFREGATVDVE